MSPAATWTPPVKRRVVGVEARQHGEVLAAEHIDMPDRRTAPAHRDNVGAPVTIHITGARRTHRR
jgi:hypothetical protein